MSIQDIIQSYSAADYQDMLSALVLESHEYRVQRFGSERMEILNSHHASNAPKSVLDVGSSTGFFIEAAQKAGWSAAGIELAKTTREFSQGRGHRVFDSPLEEIILKEEFGAVTLFDVLEHVPNPRKTLELARSLLSPSGSLFIYVPNIDSAAFALEGGSANFIMRNHLQYYSPATILHLLELTGYEALFIETRGLDVVDWLTNLELNGVEIPPEIRNSASVLQEFTNRSGFGKNLRVLARKS